MGIAIVEACTAEDTISSTTPDSVIVQNPDGKEVERGSDTTSPSTVSHRPANAPEADAEEFDVLVNVVTEYFDRQGYGIETDGPPVNGVFDMYLVPGDNKITDDGQFYLSVHWAVDEPFGDAATVDSTISSAGVVLYELEPVGDQPAGWWFECGKGLIILRSGIDGSNLDHAGVAEDVVETLCPE